MADKDLRLEKIVYILVFYNISFSWLLSLDGFQFIFLLRDSENDLYFRVWATCVQSASNPFNAPKFTTATYNIFHTYLFRQFKPSSFQYRVVRACLVYLQGKGWHQLEKEDTVKSTTPANQGGEIKEEFHPHKVQMIRGQVVENRVTGAVHEVEEHVAGADRFQLMPRQNEEGRKASEERLVKKKKPILLGIWP